MIVDFGFYLDIRPVPFRPVSVDTSRRETEKEILGRETERSNGKEGRQREVMVMKGDREWKLWGREIGRRKCMGGKQRVGKDRKENVDKKYERLN